ncbi:MAG: hypothetical protein ACXITV_00480 [Luteibaculaceae bacterium]
MRKSVLVLFAAFLFTNVSAQFSVSDDLELVQVLFKKAKTEIVMQSMGLNAEQMEKFLPVYENYEQKRRPLTKQKLEIVLAYGLEYPNMTGEKANIFANVYLNNQMQHEMLYKRYYKKMKKNIGTLDAAKWIQIEVFIQTQIRAALQAEIPVIGEIEFVQPGLRM